MARLLVFLLLSAMTGTGHAGDAVDLVVVEKSERKMVLISKCGRDSFYPFIAGAGFAPARFRRVEAAA